MAENEKNMDLCELKCTLIDALKTQMSGGVGNVDAEEAGEVVDMIKDFAQTDYYEAKAHYYRTVEKAMEEGKSRGRYGYVRGLDRYMDDRDGMEMPEWWEMDHMADTDPTVMRIYISDVLSGQELETVLIHELGHAALFSYGLLPDIHKAVKRQYWMEAEEWVCNFIADYGMRIFSIAYEVMGEDAWMFIPYELDRLIA